MLCYILYCNIIFPVTYVTLHFSLATVDADAHTNVAKLALWTLDGEISSI